MKASFPKQSMKSFISDSEIQDKLRLNKYSDRKKIEDIIQKSLSVQTLSPDEVAFLLNIEDSDIWDKIYSVAAEIKHKVYDNRIVTFAPLYMSNLCVNDCLYCGFRRSNKDICRKVLTQEEIKLETSKLCGEIGHKRLIVVYGEHPTTGVDYITESLRSIYSVKEKTKNGYGSIRRVNVNCAPLSIEDLKSLKKAGIGTYQVFQETYHRLTYENVHPAGTLKSDYNNRLYSMHRALEAGVDDVGIGVLFGLYDWKFEVMGLLYHALELERNFGIGPHTVSFPRLEPAFNTPLSVESRYRVSDNDLKKIVAVIRLAIPYTGIILTARESEKIRRDILPIGVTQTDASSKIAIGSYSGMNPKQEEEKQQFLLGDTRSLDEVIREMAEMGYITSFCTAGYRCGRTGKCIMDLLRSGEEGKFCKLNAVLTFREWLDDFASEETKRASQKVLEKEISEIKIRMPKAYESFMKTYHRIENGERDLYF